MTALHVVIAIDSDRCDIQCRPVSKDFPVDWIKFRTILSGGVLLQAPPTYHIQWMHALDGYVFILHDSYISCGNHALYLPFEVRTTFLWCFIVKIVRQWLLTLMITLDRRSHPGCPGLGLTISFPPTIFCACATAVALWTSNLSMHARYYGVIKASYRDLSSYFCKATPASKLWVSKERFWEAGGCEKLSVSLVCEVTLATLPRILLPCICVWRHSRNWRCLLEMLKVHLWHEDSTIGSWLLPHYAYFECNEWALIQRFKESIP